MPNINFSPTHSEAAKYEPVPAKKIIPEWFKSLAPIVPMQGAFVSLTAKKCMPLTDAIAAGYLIRIPADVEFKRKVTNNEEELSIVSEKMHDNSVVVSPHSTVQAPISIDGILKQPWKFNTFWSIQTPPGYSIFVTTPTYFFKHWQALPAIIDSDQGWNAPPSFPSIGAYMGSENAEWKVFAGDPVALVIPFLREEWTHSVATSIMSVDTDMSMYHMSTNPMGYYKDNFHKKKRFD